VSEVTILLF